MRASGAPPRRVRRPRAVGRPGPGGGLGRCKSTVRGGRGSGGRIAWRALMFTRVLVANRGEIAVRVIRALDELGIESVAVYSEADRDAQHVKRATEAYLLGPGPASESYLDVDKILDVIERSGAEAVHPGYGFLAENAAFARRLEDAGVTFIGPPASAIDAMGSKTKARELMQGAGVPIVPGTTDPVESVEAAEKIAEEIGYPIAVKAAGGGGGKGFRVASGPDKLRDAFEGAAREGEKFFSDATVYLERYLPDPRHVEVQVLADGHGNVVHLGERDCTIQRGHQKLVEETPSSAVDEALGEALARGRRGSPSADRRDRGRGGARGRLRERRDNRGPALAAGRVLLPRDEHAHPGRAHGHRAGDGPRPDPRAGADRGRRAADAAPGGRAPERPRARVPDQRRGPIQRLPAEPWPDHELPRARRAGRARRLVRRRGLAYPRPVRPARREARRPRRRPRARAAADAAGARRVRDRRHHDAARLPPGAARAPVLRGRRDLPRRGRVRRAGGARGGAVASQRAGGDRWRAHQLAAADARSGRQALRGRRAGAGAALRRARAPATGACRGRRARRREGGGGRPPN